MENEILLCFELVCNKRTLECSADRNLKLSEIVEGIRLMNPPEVREAFDFCQPIILCDSRTHQILDEEKTAAQLQLPDGFKILIY